MAALHPAVAAPLRAVMTPRLSVRPLSRDDADELDVVVAGPDGWGHDQGPEAPAALIERQLRLWNECSFGGCAVRERAEGRLVGIVGLATPTVAHDVLPPVTVGWRFATAVWGRWYAREAATAVLDQAFTSMRLGAVGCVTSPQNGRSVSLAERLGMTLIEERDVTGDDGATVTALLLAVAAHHWWTRSP